MARGWDDRIQAQGANRSAEPIGARGHPSEARPHPPHQLRQARSLTTQVRRAARARDHHDRGQRENQGRRERPMSLSTTPRDPVEVATMRKVGLRLVPFLILCYFIAYVDRVNVGFAALTMNKDLGLSAAAFGIGGGLFFVAYVLCEVPSNLAME